MKKFLGTIFFAATISFSTVSFADFSIEAFDKDGKIISISKIETEFIASSLPNVHKIIANLGESALGNGANLFIQYQLTDGTWRKTAAGINGNAPISWHIQNLIKDELK